jgi:hypothetical protein
VVYKEVTQSMSDLRKKIEERAHQLYIRRGGRDGDAMTDWLRAEKEIMAEANAERKGEPKEAKKPDRKRKKSG